MATWSTRSIFGSCLGGVDSSAEGDASKLASEKLIGSVGLSRTFRSGVALIIDLRELLS